ncbi:unnamed protein product [Ceutorhynchus assimilis]|uniref:Lebercilin domain-containing protein n=1 Tax=Ceutorhynchus assimilis TaxID=467358 RepID=A0A9P0GK76_9CUCU|nr:unnamed protein product [Ceutorhynchus assimilis]
MNSVSCASSLNSKSTPKTSINEENRSKSCDTNCSSNSSCFFKKRKPVNPLAYSLRPTYQKTNNIVKQRVMSAKLLKMRQLQSQLNDANFHLAEATRENQTLKTLQKRQDKALSKYENTNEDLPRLIHSHEEEIRMLIDKNKNLRRNVRELTEQLKQREEELIKSRDQLVHLEKLDKDKHLTEREKLKDLMEDYKIKLQKTEDQVTVLNRKLMLESKTAKQRLNTEMLKHKQCQRELMQALIEIDRLTGQLDLRENTVRPKNLKFHKSNLKINGKLSHSQIPVTDVKLEPLANGLRSREADRKIENTFKAPMENIRQRLSSSSTRELNPISNFSDSRDTSAGSSFQSRPSSSIKLEKLPEKNIGRIKSEETTKIINKDENDSGEESGEEDLILEYNHKKEVSFNKTENFSLEENQTDNELNHDEMLQKMEKEDKLMQEIYERKSSDDLSSTSEMEKMAGNLDEVIQRVVENSHEKFDKDLGSYCSKVLDNVKTCNKVINYHKKSLKDSKKDTDTILDTFKKTEQTENKLKQSFFKMGDDMDLVHDILNEELKFQKESNSNQNNTKSLVDLENKRKLLATLRAIDNGDSEALLDVEDQQKRRNIMRELFGNVAQ